MDHVWPGNVRHLSNCIERALNNSGFGTIRRNHLGDLDRDRLGNPRKSRIRVGESVPLPHENLFKRFLREGIVRDNPDDLAWRFLKTLTDLPPNESLDYDELVQRLGPENCDPEEFKRSLITTCSRLRSEMKAARIGWTIQSGSAKQLIQE